MQKVVKPSRTPPYSGLKQLKRLKRHFCAKWHFSSFQQDRVHLFDQFFTDLPNPPRIPPCLCRIEQESTFILAVLAVFWLRGVILTAKPMKRLGNHNFLDRFYDPFYRCFMLFSGRRRSGTMCNSCSIGQVKEAFCPVLPVSIQTSQLSAPRRCSRRCSRCRRTVRRKRRVVPDTHQVRH